MSISLHHRLALGLATFAVLAVSVHDRLAAAGGTEAEPAGQERHLTLVGGIGHWTPVDDGGPALKGDGERWSGVTGRADLEALGRSLFPAPSDSFVANGVAPGAFPLAVVREVPNFSAGTLRVRFKMLGGRSDQNAGIVLGLRPTGEYLFVRYNTKDGNVAVWQYAGGERRVVAHGAAHAQLPLDAWHELAVTVSGSKVTGVVNGDSLRVEHTLDRPPAGRVGVWTKRDAVTVFRDFRVTP